MESTDGPSSVLAGVFASQTEAVRCRQHVNPLKKELQVPLPPQDWAAIYTDTSRPLIVDVGCGSGRFLLALSRNFQNHNLLGLDIRTKVCPLNLMDCLLLACLHVEGESCLLKQIHFIACFHQDIVIP